MRPIALPAPGGKALTGFFFLTGFSGLVFEVVWSRAFASVLGSTLQAAAAVLASFLAGLALGAWTFGRIADRRGPGFATVRMYGLLELGVAAAGVAVPLLLLLATPAYDALASGLESAAARTAARVLLGALVLPCTFLMGATLPVLVLAASRVSGGADGPGRRFAGLYAANTLGAAAGAAVAAFVLLPAAGIPGALGTAALLNVAVGLRCVLAKEPAGISPAGSSPPPAPGSRRGRAAASGASPTAVIATAAFLSGATVLLLEVAVFRVLALLLGGSVYAFAIMLAAFILGLGAGAALSARLAGHPTERAFLFPVGQLVAVLLLWPLQALADDAPRAVQALVSALAGRPGAILAVECAALLIAVALPATLLGTGFPTLVRLASGSPGGFGTRLGFLYAANTAGSLAGTLAGGFLALPRLGSQGALLFGMALALGAAAVFAGAPPRDLPARQRRASIALAIGCIVLVPTILLLRRPWDLSSLTIGPYLYEARHVRPGQSEVIYHREGSVSAVTVVRTGPFLGLKVDGKTDASNGGDMATQAFSGLLPPLLHPDPRRVLVVGLASGVTAGTALSHPSVRRLDCVEIEPAVVPAAAYFRPWNGGVLGQERLHLHIDDARAFLRVRPGPWDVIISEPSNPWIAGVANLFTREFFATLRKRLAPDGVVCQWIQAYNLSPDMLRLVIRTFLAEFPEATLWTTSPEASDLLLIARADGRLPDPGRALAAALRDPRRAEGLRYSGIAAPRDLMLRFSCGPEALRRLAGTGPLQTEMRPRLEFAAPLDLYRPDLYARNIELLRAHREPATRYWPLASELALQVERGFQARDLVLEAHATSDDDSEGRFESRLRRALERDPEDRDARRVLAEYLTEKSLLVYQASRDPRSAIPVAEEATAIDGAYPKGWQALGLFWDDAGVPERALRAYRTYLGLFPWHPEIRRRQIELLRRLGDEDAARAAEREAGLLEPGGS